MVHFDAPVRPTVDALKAFVGQLMEDLDTEDGGFGLWVGHTDRPRLALLADYLIQCVDGVAEALLDAALSAKDHSEQLTADNQWSIAVQTALAAQPGVTEEAVIAALWSRGDHEQKRERKIYASAEHCLAHLVQSLDRVAAAMIIVGGLKVPALKIGWPTLVRHANDPDPRNRVYDAPRPEGVELQRELAGLALAWPSHGPADWLPWLIETRNAMTHRGQSSRFIMALTERSGRYSGMLRAFYAQPSLSDMHSMAQMRRTGNEALQSHVILRRSDDILTGMISSTSAYIAEILIGLVSLWDQRRRDPGLIIQPGKQWSLEVAEPFRFPGYGPPPRVTADTLKVHPTLGKRLLAAKVLEGEEEFWT